VRRRGGRIDCVVKSLGKLYSPRDKVTEKIRIELNSSRNRRRLYCKGRGITAQLYRHDAPPPPPHHQRTFMYSDQPHIIIIVILGRGFKCKLQSQRAFQNSAWHLKEWIEYDKNASYK